MASFTHTCLGVVLAIAYACAQQMMFPYERSQVPSPTVYPQQNMIPDCPLESHPDTRTMFIMRGPLGDAEPLPDCPLESHPDTRTIFIMRGPLGDPEPLPDCPLESHPDTRTMFIMRGPLGDPEPHNCPPGTYFLRSVCSCVNNPIIEKCNLRPSSMGAGWYEENVFGVWIQRPCGPGSAFNPATCDCSLTM